MTPSQLTPPDARSLLRYLYRLSEELTPEARTVFEALSFSRLPDGEPAPAWTAPMLDMVCSDVGRELSSALGASMPELSVWLHGRIRQRLGIMASVQAAELEAIPKAVGQC